MYILDTSPISILERPGPETDRLLARLAGVPSSEIYVTPITQNERDFRGSVGLRVEDWTR